MVGLLLARVVARERLGLGEPVVEAGQGVDDDRVAVGAVEDPPAARGRAVDEHDVLGAVPASVVRGDALGHGCSLEGSDANRGVVDEEAVARRLAPFAGPMTVSRRRGVATCRSRTGSAGPSTPPGAAPDRCRIGAGRLDAGDARPTARPVPVAAGEAVATEPSRGARPAVRTQGGRCLAAPEADGATGSALAASRSRPGRRSSMSTGRRSRSRSAGSRCVLSSLLPRTMLRALRALTTDWWGDMLLILRGLRRAGMPALAFVLLLVAASAAAPQSSPTVLSTSEGRPFHAASAYVEPGDRLSGSLAVWTSAELSGGQEESISLAGRLLDAEGRPAGAKLVLGALSPGSRGYLPAHVAWNAQAHAWFVVYARVRTTTPRADDVLLRVVRPDGSMEEEQVLSVAGGSASVYAPHVECEPSGTCLAAWRTNGDEIITIRVLAVDGVPSPEGPRAVTGRQRFNDFTRAVDATWTGKDWALTWARGLPCLERRRCGYKYASQALLMRVDRAGRSVAKPIKVSRAPKGVRESSFVIGSPQVCVPAGGGRLLLAYDGSPGSHVDSWERKTGHYVQPLRLDGRPSGRNRLRLPAVRTSSGIQWFDRVGGTCTTLLASSGSRLEAAAVTRRGSVKRRALGVQGGSPSITYHGTRRSIVFDAPQQRSDDYPRRVMIAPIR